MDGFKDGKDGFKDGNSVTMIKVMNNLKSNPLHQQSGD